ncbi:hypothetical protein V5N34_15755 [Streptomyces baarnensis]|uniref:hypothetical protein n=1 Tax=Streptomyces TaxID=1883 RepID=UPI0029ADDA85|nr:hypothetical protein [Streptomyces sp. ME02-6979.5a]MDX3342651.1 hypothetical protein [Streptomyces sp. ME02-6979.5a]
MSASTPPSSLTDDYTRRIAEDLVANRGEQERVRDELTRLRAELSQLEESEHVLVKMQQVLGADGASAAKHGKETTAVPKARRTAGEADTDRSSRGAEPSAAPGSGSTATAGRNAGEPTWRELTVQYLAGADGPRSAAEVSAALAEAHPHRQVQVTVVRSALEQGVAQARLERSKQGRSVFYSPAPAAAASFQETAAESP